MYLKKFIGFFVLVLLVTAANRLIPPQLTKTQVHDQTQIVRLAQEEKFTIPLSGRTISHRISYVPENHHDCEFISPKIQYKVIEESMGIFDMDSKIIDILPLLKREVVIVADPFYNIASFSIDQHFPMKPGIPKTSIATKPKQKILSPVLVASENEQFIYLLSEDRSFMFSWNSVTNKKQIELGEQLRSIRKAIQYQGYIIICSDMDGILIYKIMLDDGHRLKFIQKLEIKDPGNPPIDMQLNKNTQLLYVLSESNNIDIYSFDPKEDRSIARVKVLHVYDSIDLTNITLNHGGKQSQPYQYIGNLNIEISRNRDQQTLMILFSHNLKTVIAQLSYLAQSKQFYFVRYYKFAVQVEDIQIVQDVMVVIGDKIIGVFPYGIDPRLIEEEFNGFMMLSSLERVKVTQAPFVVGVNKNSLEYGGLFLNNQAGLNCHIESNSKLNHINFEANLTSCDENSPILLENYCQYQKTFIIERMDIATSAPVATSLWVLMILFTLLIVAGLCCIFVMHKRKQRQIRKLQLYFEERRRSEIPPSSDRPQQ